MPRIWVFIGCLFAGTGVAAGAFGAHALRDALDPASLDIYHTAARYQLVHALALIGVGIMAHLWPDRRWKLAGGLFTAGTLIFAGSLYTLAMTGVGWLGAVTPIGGACFLAGWLVAGLVALRGAGE